MPHALKLADGLTLPLAAVTEKLAFLGRTGSGKTYAAMKLAELMLGAGAQIGAIDPVGVWRALRVPAEAHGRAFDVVVFGGLYGDLPLEPSAGALVADVVSDRGISFVLDISQMIPSEQQRFCRAFADRFFQRRKAAPAAVHLFLEECQEVIPQNPMGDEALTLHAFQRLWKLGRNFGIGGSLISQRPQEISKKALNMSGTLFAFQMTGPQERKAIREWVADHGIASAIESVLQKLKTGEPHVESPTFLEYSGTVRIQPRVTADLSSTPKVGASTVAKRPLTPIDVEQLKTAMAETIEKQKADDPRELRRQIAELKRQLAANQQAEAAHQPVNAPDKVQIRVLTDADRELLKTLAHEFATFSEDIGPKADAMLSSLADRAKAAIDEALGRWTAEVDRRRALFAERLEKARVQRVFEKLERLQTPNPGRNHSVNIPDRESSRNRPEIVGSIKNIGVLGSQATGLDSVDRSLGKGERLILTAIGQHTPARVTREQLTVLTGYKRSSRDTYLQRLKQADLVDEDRDGFCLTRAGADELGPDFEPLPKGDALRDHWLRTLPQGEAKVLGYLTAQYPREVTREAISEITGYQRSSRDTYLQRLGTRRLIENVGRGLVRASEALFS